MNLNRSVSRVWPVLHKPPDEPAAGTVQPRSCGPAQNMPPVQDDLQQVHPQLPPPLWPPVQGGRLWLHKAHGVVRGYSSCCAGKKRGRCRGLGEWIGRSTFPTLVIRTAFRIPACSRLTAFQVPVWSTVLLILFADTGWRQPAIRDALPSCPGEAFHVRYPSCAQVPSQQADQHHRHAHHIQ
jgi:hypothetical protein